MATKESVAEKVLALRASLPAGVRLVAVSKYQSAAAIMAAYGAGQRCFGESYVQELLTKAAVLPKDIAWHFIGHLQSNKVRQIVPFISMIHSVDSLHLLRTIQRQAALCGRVVDILFEVHLAAESTKHGLSPADSMALAAEYATGNYPNVRLCGLMTMATNTPDSAQIEREFAAAATLFATMKERYFSSSSAFCECSWGMSDDYPLALRHRATLIRIGSALFGPRPSR